MNSSLTSMQSNQRVPQMQMPPIDNGEFAFIETKSAHSKLATMPFLEALHIVRRYKYVAILWLVFWLALGSLYIYLTPNLYTASVSIVLNPSGQTSTPKSEPASLPTLDSAQTESQMQVLKSERILSSVFDALQIENYDDFNVDGGSSLSTPLNKVNVTPPVVTDSTIRKQAIFEAFSNSVAVKRVGQSYVIELSYTSKNRGNSAKIVNSIAMQYLASQIELKAASIQRGSEFLQGRITMIQAQLKTAKESVLTGTVPNFQFPDADAQIISSAAPPLRKSAPKTGLVLIISSTLSLASGLLFLLGRSMLDKTVRSSSQILTYYSVPCLIAIPYIRRLPRLLQSMTVSNQRPESGVISDFKNLMSDLYTGVATSIPGSPEKIIGIFSWSAGVGKSTISSSLAEVVARSGRPVLLIQVNVSYQSNLQKSIRDEQDEADENFRSRDDEVLELNKISQKLWVLKCDAISNGKLFDLSSIFEKLSELRMYGTPFVIIDMPAITSCAEVLSLSKYMSYALLVVEAHKTTLIDAERALAALKVANAVNLGVAINKIK